MSLHQIVEITRRSFRANDAAMNTIAQNVANIDTPGYARRRITLRSEAVTGSGIQNSLLPGVARGVGVSVQAYERTRDLLLQRAGWEAQTGLGSSAEEYRILSAAEGLFPVQGDGTLQAAVADFFNAWSDLANNPTDTGARLALRNRADTVARTLNGLDLELRRLSEQTRQDLDAGVARINELLDRIAALNESVRTTRAGGITDYAAADERDVLVKELAAMVPLRVEEDTAGNFNLTIGGKVVLESSHVTPLRIEDDGGTLRVVFGDTGLAFDPAAEGDGKLGAWLRGLTDTLPGMQQALDTLAGTLVEEVNTLHRSGYGLDGGTGRDFFDPAGTSAGSIQLDAGILADATTIAASAAAGNLGDSTTALAIAELRTTPLFNGGTDTPENYIIGVVSDLGARAERASARATSQSAVADHLDSLQRGATGVSMDEELTDLIRYQQAYGATARVVSTVQAMFDSLLAM